MALRVQLEYYPSYLKLIQDKNFWQDCDVLICHNDETVLLTKKDIANYTCKMSASYLNERLPKMEITFDIVDWDSVSSSTKTRFLTKDIPFLIFYVIDNTMSREALVAYTKDCKVNYKKTQAHITLVSRFERENMLQGIKLGDSWAKKEQLSSTILTKLLGSGTTYENEMDDFTVKSFAPQMTYAEILQNLCLFNVAGVWFKYRQGGDGYVAGMKNHPTYSQTYMARCNSYLSEINVNDDYNESIYDNYRTATVYYSIPEAEEKLLGNYSIVLPTSSLGNSVDLSEEFENYIVSRVLITTTTPVKYPTYVQSGLRHINYVETTGSGTQTLAIYGKKYALPYNQVEGEMSYLVAFDTNYYCDVIKARLENYLQHYKKISFTCRCNPFIEPLDMLVVEGYSTIYVEEIELKFDGGFTGNIVGRQIRDFGIKAPIISNVSYSSDSDYGFSLKNPNNFTCRVFIVSSDGTTFSYSCPANTTVRFSTQYIPELLTSFRAYFVNRDLFDAVYCYLKKNDDINTPVCSDSAIILEERYFGTDKMPEPTVSFSYSIDEDNNVSITLTITNVSYLIGGILEIWLGNTESIYSTNLYSNSSITLTEDDLPYQFIEAVRDYDIDQLNNNVVAKIHDLIIGAHSKATIMSLDIEEIRAPVLKNLYVSGDDNDGFEIYNSNAVVVGVYIHYSGSKEIMVDYLNPYETKRYYTSDLGFLKMSFSEYERDYLDDDVYCYFIDDDGIYTSDNTIILEADA